MWAWVALSCWLLAWPAGAQTPAEISLAREQFTIGVEAARVSNWAEALTAFERSYALYVNPETLFNIAGARQKLGKLVAASEAYRSYLRSPVTAGDAGRRAQAEARLAEITPEIARVGLRIEGILPGDIVALDGQALSRAALEADLPVDPGEHALELTHDAEVVAKTTFAVHARERVEVLLRREDAASTAAPVLIPSPRMAADATVSSEPGPSLSSSRTDEPARVPLVRKWWLWTAVGAVIAGGVVAALLLTGDDQAKAEPEVRGNVGEGVVEIQ